jgi:hypothetical protein
MTLPCHSQLCSIVCHRERMRGDLVVGRDLPFSICHPNSLSLSVQPQALSNGFDTGIKVRGDTANPC